MPGSHHFFPQHWALQVAYTRDKQEMTEIHAAACNDNYGGILRVPIAQNPLYLYSTVFTNSLGMPPCSDISRYRDSVPRLSQTENIPLAFSP
jgi:hypothetical protein